jgi:hypothetical protein
MPHFSGDLPLISGEGKVLNKDKATSGISGLNDWGQTIMVKSTDHSQDESCFGCPFKGLIVYIGTPSYKSKQQKQRTHLHELLETPNVTYSNHFPPRSTACKSISIPKTPSNQSAKE